MRKKKTLEQLNDAFGLVKDHDYNFDLIKRYFNNKDHSQSFQTLSDKTCNDLDFEELFMFLDRTTSKVGQQYLYKHLRTLPTASPDLDFKEKLIQKLKVNNDFRNKALLHLNKLNKNDAYYIPSLFQEEHARRPKWFFIIQLLALTSLLSLCLLPVLPQLFFVFLAVFLVNIVFHYWNKRHLFQYLESLPQLAKLNSVASHLHNDHLFNKLNPDLNHSIEQIRQLNAKMSLFRLEAKLQNEAEAIFWSLLELFKIAFLIEPLLLFGVLQRLNTMREELENIYCFVGEIDILLSTASLRSGLDQYCIPVIQPAHISAKQMYHPLISNCVANTVNFSDKSVLLTGSNMSGKTSFIRTIGLNIISGLTLNTCFAQAMSFPRLRVFSAIRVSDDLINNKSYYFEEVLTIKNMLDTSTDGIPSLFLLDEIFKGTNTIERIAAGKAVLSALAQKNNSVFVSTHDIELTDLLDQEYELYHFSEVVKDNNVDFDYKLKAGKLKNRNAIQILQINDYPQNVIKEALSISAELDQITINPKPLFTHKKMMHKN